VVVNGVLTWIDAPEVEGEGEKAGEVEMGDIQ
jgi:hypothetical protein